MSEGQEISKPALFHLHAGVLQHAMVFGGRKDQGSRTRASAGEYEPVECHGDCGPQTALAIMDSEDQPSPGHERSTATFQQTELLIGGQILQDIQNENQSGRRKIESANIGHAQVGVEAAEGLASDRDAMRVQVATHQAAAAVTESCKTQG